MNAFEPIEGIPATIIAGDDVAFRRRDLLSTYPADAYSVAFKLAPQAGGAPTSIDGAADAAGWVFEIPAATSAAYVAGSWVWSIVVKRTSDGKVKTIDSGGIRVAPPVSSGADQRSDAVRQLDMINAVIQGRITKDVQSYTIAGRSIVRIPIAELRRMRNGLIRRIKAENGGSVIETARVVV